MTCISRRDFVVAAPAVVASAAVARPAFAAAVVRIGYIGDFNGASLAAIATDRNLWAEHGLQPDLKAFTNGPIQIQAFGSGWQTEDGTQKPVFQYFDTLTDVDPHFISAYRFANLIIGDQRGDYVLGQEILRKGVYKNPMNYDLPYLGVYNAVWTEGKPEDARWFEATIPEFALAIAQALH